jgi:hypothetical protein
MKRYRLLGLSLATPIAAAIAAIVFAACDKKNPAADRTGTTDYSGTYCITTGNMELVIDQSETDVAFRVLAENTVSGTGRIVGRSMTLTAAVSSDETVRFELEFSSTGQDFSGTYVLLDTAGTVRQQASFSGSRGKCPVCDIDLFGVPKFVTLDFTQSEKIRQISRFRSGVGHSFTDGFESCRSMKHYFGPFETYRKNRTVEIFSPVDGTVVSISQDGHGASVGLNNKQVQIKPDGQPAFIFRIFHTDLASEGVVQGMKVKAGDLIGYARMFYDDLNEYANSFDIAVHVNTPSGTRLVSYFETLQDSVFAGYTARGPGSREDFIISRQARDSDPLQCDGETFLSAGNIHNWVVLN